MPEGRCWIELGIIVLLGLGILACGGFALGVGACLIFQHAGVGSGHRHPAGGTDADAESHAWNGAPEVAAATAGHRQPGAANGTGFEEDRHDRLGLGGRELG